MPQLQNAIIPAFFSKPNKITAVFLGFPFGEAPPVRAVERIKNALISRLPLGGLFSPSCHTKATRRLAPCDAR